MKRLGLSVGLLIIVLINITRLFTPTNNIQPLIAYPAQGECPTQDWYCPKDLIILNPDTLEYQRLEIGYIEPTMISWSPNYDSLLYLTASDAGYLLNRIFLTGETQESMLGIGLGGWASWSPDGKQLAVNIMEMGTLTQDSFGLYLLSPDGSQNRRITQDLPIFGYPVWQPDGQALLINASLRNYGYNVLGIWRVNIQDESLQNITDDFTSAERFTDFIPAYSTDGQYITFISERTGRPEVFLMNANGSDVRQLTFHGVEYYSNPEWVLNDTAIVYFDDGDEDRIFFAFIDLETLAISEIDIEPHLSGYDLSPDRTRIVFIQNADLDHPRLCIISLITHETQCPDVPSPDFSGVPVWDYR